MHCSLPSNRRSWITSLLGMAQCWFQDTAIKCVCTYLRIHIARLIIERREICDVSTQTLHASTLLYLLYILYSPHMADVYNSSQFGHHPHTRTNLISISRYFAPIHHSPLKTNLEPGTWMNPLIPSFTHSLNSSTISSSPPVSSCLAATTTSPPNHRLPLRKLNSTRLDSIPVQNNNDEHRLLLQAINSRRIRHKGRSNDGRANRANYNNNACCEKNFFPSN